MEITIVIVAGVIILTAVAMVGDYFTKTKVAALSSAPADVQALLGRIETLEAKVHEQESKIGLLENDIAFTTKLLENKKNP